MAVPYSIGCLCSVWIGYIVQIILLFNSYDSQLCNWSKTRTPYFAGYSYSVLHWVYLFLVIVKVYVLNVLNFVSEIWYMAHSCSGWLQSPQCWSRSSKKREVCRTCKSCPLEGKFCSLCDNFESSHKGSSPLGCVSKSKQKKSSWSLWIRDVWMEWLIILN